MMKFLKMILPVILIMAVSLQAQPMHNDRMMNENRRKQMETMRIWKMTEFLELTKEQAEKFFPRLREQDEIVRKLLDKQMEIMNTYEGKIKQEDFTPEQKDIQKLVKELNETEVKIAGVKSEFILSLSDILTPRQQIRYLLFEPHFRRNLMRELRNSQGERD